MKVLLILVLSFVSSLSQAQSLSGIVQEGNSKGLDLALVGLMSIADSSFVKAEYTDVDGSYILATVAEGNYTLSISLLGYQDHTQDIRMGVEDIALDPIVLIQSSQMIEEVTVTAKIPFIERKLDRTIINPEGMISTAGSTALEVLERAPGLSLNSDGSLMLKGRSGVSVYINDKPSYISGSELENYLSSLPAGSIKRIEIMTNPPARYEAAGNSGVINIITKRNTLQGLYGNTAISGRKGKYWSSNNYLNLNYNNNKLSLYSNLASGVYENFQDLFINRFYKTEADELESAFEQNSFNYRKGKYLNAKIGADYYITEHTTFGISYKRDNSPTVKDTDNTSKITDAVGVLLQTVVADNDQDNSFNNEVYNAYVTRTLDTLGSSLSVDADYVSYTTGSDQVFQNFIYDEDGVQSFADQINGEIPSTIKIYAAKTDYTKRLTNGSRFEAGLKTARTETDNEAIYSTTIDGVTTPDYNLSNRFLYDEKIHSAYLNFTTNLGPIDIQAGLRGESTSLEGNQLGNVQKSDTSFTRSYKNLFPTFYAGWTMDQKAKNVLTFSYGKRINRPYFRSLNPFISPLDKFTFYSGNPDLLPTFSDNYSLAHTWDGKITTTLNYSKTSDNINETLEIRDGIYYSRPGNISSSESYTLSVSGAFDVSKWYRFNTYAELGHNRFDSKLYTEQLASRGTYYALSANNTFQLSKGWQAELNGNYRSDLVYAQLILNSYSQVGFGIKKSFWEGKGSAKLNVSDIFLANRGAGIINNLRRTDADWNSTRDTRRVTLTMSLRFGKSTTQRKKYNSSGSDTEQRRL